MAPRILFEDADTGKLIPQDQFNPAEYDVVGSEEVEEPGFWENLGRQTGGNLSKAIGGLGTATEDAFNYLRDNLNEVSINEGLKNLGIYLEDGVPHEAVSAGKALSHMAADAAGLVGDNMQGFGQEMLEPTKYVDPYSAKGVTGQVGGGLAQMAIPLLSRALIPMGLLYGTSLYGQDLKSFQDQGASLDDARRGAGLDATIQGGLSMIPGAAMFREGSKLVPRITQTMLANEALALGGVASSEAGRREAGLEPQSFDELSEQAAQTILPTALMSVPMAAGGHLATRRAAPSAGLEVPALDTSISTLDASEPTFIKDIPDEVVPKREYHEPPPILEGKKPITLDGDKLVQNTAPKPIRQQIQIEESSRPRTEEQVSEAQQFLRDISEELATTKERLQRAADAKYGVGKAPPPVADILTPTQEFTQEVTGSSPNARSADLQAEPSAIREDALSVPTSPKRDSSYQEPLLLPYGPRQTNASSGGVVPPSPHITWKDILTREEGFWEIFNRKAEDNLDRAINKPVKFTQKLESKDQAKLRGLVGKSQKEIPIASKLLAHYENEWSFEQTIADEHPSYRPVFKVAHQYTKDRNIVPSRLRARASAFYDLPLQRRDEIRNYLYSASDKQRKGIKLDERPETLKAKGWDDRAIAGLIAVRNTLSDGLELVRSGLKEEAKLIQDPGERQQYLARVDRFIEEKKVEGYVPRSRFGDYKLEFDDANGTYNFELFESLGHAKKRAKELNSQGITPRIGRLRGLVDEAYQGMNADLMSQIIAHDANVKDGRPSPPVEGFKGHLLNSKNVPGYSMDFDRVLADYAQGAANFYNAKKAKVAFENAIKYKDPSTPEYQAAKAKFDAATKGLDPKSPAVKEARAIFDDEIRNLDPTSPLYSRAIRLRDDMLRSDSLWGEARKVVSFKFLANNAKSSFVNSFGQILNAMSTLARYTNKPEMKMAISMKKAYQFMRSPEAFIKKNPELGRALQEAFTDGTLQDNATRNLSALARGSKVLESFPESVKKFGIKEGAKRYIEGKQRTLKYGGGKQFAVESYNDAMKASMWTFGLGEELARASSFTAAFDVLSETNPKATFAEKLAFAEDFSNRTNGVLDKYNQPPIARSGPGSLMLLYKMQAGNWIRLLRDNFKADRKAWTRQLGYYVAAAGFAGVPGFNLIMRLAEGLGLDVKGGVRDIIGYLSNKVGAGEYRQDISNVFLYGGLDPLGFRLTGSIGMQDIIPTPDAATYESVVKTVGGPAASILVDAVRSAQNYSKYGNAYRLVEELSPEFLGNAMEAYRYSEEGARTRSGEPLVKDPSAWTIFGRALGFYPAEVADKYEENRAIAKNKEAGRENDNINWRMADAMRRKDKEEIQQIFEESIDSLSGDPANWRKIDNASVMMNMLKESAPDLYHYRTTPDRTKGGIEKIRKRFPNNRDR